MSKHIYSRSIVILLWKLNLSSLISVRADLSIGSINFAIMFAGDLTFIRPLDRSAPKRRQLVLHIELQRWVDDVRRSQSDALLKSVAGHVASSFSSSTSTVSEREGLDVERPQ
jgi:hypothetical protein